MATTHLLAAVGQAQSPNGHRSPVSETLLSTARGSSSSWGPNQAGTHSGEGWTSAEARNPRVAGAPRARAGPAPAPAPQWGGGSAGRWPHTRRSPHPLVRWEAPGRRLAPGGRPAREYASNAGVASSSTVRAALVCGPSFPAPPRRRPGTDASCCGMTAGDLEGPAGRCQPGVIRSSIKALHVTYTPGGSPPAGAYLVKQPSVRWSPPVSRSTPWIHHGRRGRNRSSCHCLSLMHMPRASTPLPCRRAVEVSGQQRGFRSWAVGVGVGLRSPPPCVVLLRLGAGSAGLYACVGSRFDVVWPLRSAGERGVGDEGLVRGGNGVLVSVVRLGGGLGGMRCGGGRSRRGCRSGLC